MKIRTALYNDLSSIVDIYNQAIEERFCTADLDMVTVEQRDSWFKEHTEDHYPIFVAEEATNISGWCSLSPWRSGRRALHSVAEISYYVAKDQRRKGIGKALFDYTLEKCPKLGLNSVFAILLDRNTPSIRILKKYGFELWGYFPNVAEIDGIRCGQIIYGKSV